MSASTPSPGEPWTILRLLDWTTRFFESKGIDTARLDAELLLAHALGCRRIDLYARYDEVPDGQPLDQFREMVRQRARRVPAKYLTGETEFRSLALAVEPSVIIPRPETEFLVEQALERVPVEEEEQVLADLGTGSGAIAIALAVERPQARVVATDASAEALAVARANAERHEVAEQIAFRQGCWFEALEAGRAFDAIVSNPPYVATADLDAAMPEVRHHEPRAALDGGPDGRDALRELVAEAPAWLKPGGWLIVEVGAGQAQAVADLARETGAYAVIDVAPDFAGIDRVVAMQKS
ncbi:MAG: peptide chain release factor N(5)-glutamine methyltransferase [Planctomycetota bacterium]